MRRVAVKLQLKSDNHNVVDGDAATDNNIEGPDPLDLTPTSTDIAGFDY
jgi:hypothetical protein